MQYIAIALKEDGEPAGWSEHLDAGNDEDAYNYAHNILQMQFGDFGATGMEVHRLEKIGDFQVELPEKSKQN